MEQLKNEWFERPHVKEDKVECVCEGDKAHKECTFLHIHRRRWTGRREQIA